MKSLKEYIYEADKARITVSQWLENVKIMYKWYCDNYNTFYDSDHWKKTEYHKPCELIDNKKTIADCSGFVAACLCLSGLTTYTESFNVRLGSFNHYRNPNLLSNDITDREGEFIENKIKYLIDLKDFECIKLKDTDDLSEIKAGDILVKGSHVTIAADDGAKHLYDWGEAVKNKHKDYNPVKFYVPVDKNQVYPYRSYWRLKK